MIADTRVLVDAFVEAKIAAGRRPTTIEAYHYALDPLVARCPQLSLSLEDLTRFYAKEGWALDTVHKAYGVLRTFYRWLVNQGVLARDLDPFLKMETPPRARKLPRYLPVGDLRHLVEVGRPPFERALLMVLVDTGARIGELEGLNRDCIDGNTLRLADGKTGERIVPLSPDVAGYLRSLPTFHLFPKHQGMGKAGLEIADLPASTATLRRRVTRILKRAGFGPPKCGPHLLRHSFATAYIRRGGDLATLARILGHTSTRMTEVYLSLDTSMLQEKHRTASAWRGVMEDSTPGEAPGEHDFQVPPDVSLPPEIADVPLVHDGLSVALFLSRDRRQYHDYWYIRARPVGRRSRNWSIASLGTDLPPSLERAYRWAIARENGRRWMLLDQETAPGQGDRVRSLLAVTDPGELGIDVDLVDPDDADLARWIWEAVHKEPAPRIDGGTWADVVRLMKRERPGWWHVCGMIFRDPELRARYEATG